MQLSALIEAINLILNVALLIIFIILYNEIRDVLNHARNFIRVAELNAKATDSTKERMVEVVEKVRTEAKSAAQTAATVALQSAEEVKTSVEQIPVKVVEEIKRSSSSDSADSSNKLPVINVSKLPSTPPLT